jgi:hypothetical protein
MAITVGRRQFIVPLGGGPGLTKRQPRLRRQEPAQHALCMATLHEPIGPL